ncbi:MAG: pilus assembly protein [Firmicutes bacterium]|nr:pilus assembly protein [Bacillota bacterium]
MFVRWLQDTRGNVVLEFALVFPLFLALAFGIVNLAVLLNNDIVASAAARDAAHAAAVTGDVEAAKARGGQVLEEGGLGAAGASVEISDLETGRVTAEVRHRSPVLVPGFAALVGGEPWDAWVSFAKRASYRVEYRHWRGAERREPVCVGQSCR